MAMREYKPFSEAVKELNEVQRWVRDVARDYKANPVPEMWHAIIELELWCNKYDRRIGNGKHE